MNMEKSVNESKAEQVFVCTRRPALLMDMEDCLADN